MCVCALVCELKVFLVALAPFFDDWRTLNVWLVHSTHPAAGIANIGASCAMAILINWSTARVLAISTPVAYLIVGHCKTCVNILVGYFLFGGQVDMRNALGVGVAIVGIVAYGCERYSAVGK